MSKKEPAENLLLFEGIDPQPLLKLETDQLFKVTRPTRRMRRRKSGRGGGGDGIAGSTTDKTVLPGAGGAQ